jgi:hypothetical protein
MLFSGAWQARIFRTHFPLLPFFPEALILKNM